ncbi:hypothetical protein DPMN_035793 [Dreissena polymorpha]|uniref:Uncharacterized protein n=1 Tax=Dreissena polymorpha TaxID=45954 RepID=A0A9D4MA98_DREPO|nr:hypothetical protein DPMN_035793 [Dreissena polymorpha]
MFFPVALNLLEVHKIPGSHFQDVRDKVILHGRVHLHDVATLARDIDVVDCGRLQGVRAPSYGKRMRSGRGTEIDTKGSE